jgi:methylmalonyl-CoA mutase N-terminal domain/subunit
VESGERRVVGVNAYQNNAPLKVPRLKIAESARRSQAKRLAALRSRRNARKFDAALDRLRKVAETPDGNTMPPVLDALKARATLGEIVHAFQDVFGRYRERSMY